MSENSSSLATLEEHEVLDAEEEPSTAIIGTATSSTAQTHDPPSDHELSDNLPNLLGI